jgi:hypothetical protein
MTDKYFSLPCSVLPKFVLVYFLLAIILLSVLRITASDHPFGIFKKYVYLAYFMHIQGENKSSNLKNIIQK